MWGKEGVWVEKPICVERDMGVGRRWGDSRDMVSPRLPALEPARPGKQSESTPPAHAPLSFSSSSFSLHHVASLNINNVDSSNHEMANGFRGCMDERQRQRWRERE